MSIEQILALALFAFATCITPGPNNTMILASSVNFGLRRTAPALVGMDLGFAFMLLAVGAGIGGLFTMFPLLHTVLKYVGAAYLIYLAWHIATAKALQSAGDAGRPVTFLQAAAFQWLNPKGWMAAVGAVATYTPPQPFFINLLIVTFVFALVMAPCITTWAAAGAVLRVVLSNPINLRIFNITMGLLLVASLYPVFFGG